MLLETLTNAVGPSGFEGDVREIIKNEIRPYVDEIKIDRMGNIIAHKKGFGPKVVIDAYMDEVSFIITAYNNDGTLKFECLGDINGRVIPSKVVFIGEDKVPGVIGLKPIHLQSKSEREKHISYKDCCIDIGSNSKEETKKIIDLGDFAVFDTEFSEFGKGFIKGKAFNDRIGCAVLIEAIKGNYNCDLYAVFNVQGEIGGRGAYVSAFNVQPDIGIVIEGTVCDDIPDISNNSNVIKLNYGPVISMMDKCSIFNAEIIEDLINVASNNKIPYQRSGVLVDGNDVGAITMSGEGAKVAAISVPCRYIHSSVSVASLEDYENTKKIIIEYLKTF